MDHIYSASQGQNFLSPDELFPSSNLMDFVLQYGDEALDSLANIEDPDQQAFIQELIDAGLLEEYTDENGQRRLRLSPRSLKGLQHRCLEEVFANLRKGAREGHRTQDTGRTSERSDGTRPYRFGDPLSQLDLGATMRNAIKSGNALQPNKTRLPLRLSDRDFELHQTEGSTDCATVMLLDLSGSMYRYGRFIQAKRIALGMQAMIAGRFPHDTLDFVSFYSLADVIQPRDLPLVMPKPVTVYDHEVRLRMPLEQARQKTDQVPQHFTNLQLGLRQARAILNRRGATNKQIFVITDGQPTAHVEPGPTGEDMLYLLYPPTARTRDATLGEAMKCHQASIRIATFALIEDYFGMDWVGFVDQITRLTRGVAYYCTSEDLGSTIVESYLTGKKTKSYVN